MPCARWLSSTVAILAQGTSWAVAVTQAFFIFVAVAQLVVCWLRSLAANLRSCTAASCPEQTTRMDSGSITCIRARVRTPRPVPQLAPFLTPVLPPHHSAMLLSVGRASCVSPTPVHSTPSTHPPPTPLPSPYPSCRPSFRPPVRPSPFHLPWLQRAARLTQLLQPIWRAMLRAGRCRSVVLGSCCVAGSGCLFAILTGPDGVPRHVFRSCLCARRICRAGRRSAPRLQQNVVLSQLHLLSPHLPGQAAQRVVVVTKYTWPGSNWRPSACGADVIATRPQVLRVGARRLVALVCWVCGLRTCARKRATVWEFQAGGCSRDSSAGRASDRRSEGPRFDPGSRHVCDLARWLWCLVAVRARFPRAPAQHRGVFATT